MFVLQSYDFSVPLFLCFRHFVRSFCHIPCMAVAGAYDLIRKITVCHRQKHTTLRAKTLYATGNTIVCYCQYHRMLLPIPLYAIGGSIVCQSRTAGSPVKKQWWRPQPPPLHSIFRPTCRRRGRRSFHLSQGDFLHRAAHLDDIDTVAKAAYNAVCAAIDAHSPGGIYLDHRRGCRAVAALDGYHTVNHLDCHL